MRSRFGLRANRPIGQTDSFLGILSCLSQYPVRLNQQLAIDPRCPSKAQQRMSYTAGPLDCSVEPSDKRCDPPALAPVCGRRVAPSGLATLRENQKSCALLALSPLRAPGFCSYQHRRADRGFQGLAPSSPGTAVPRFRQPPSPDSLCTSKSADGLSELA